MKKRHNRGTCPDAAKLVIIYEYAKKFYLCGKIYYNAVNSKQYIDNS